MARCLWLLGLGWTIALWGAGPLAAQAPSMPPPPLPEIPFPPLPEEPVPPPEAPPEWIEERVPPEPPLFGLNFFEGAAGVSFPLQNVPIPPTYRIAPGDVLEVRYWSRLLPQQVVPVTVDPLGRIHLELVGSLTIHNLTLAEVRDLLQRQMARFYNGVTVEVTLTQLHAIEVFVTGEARQPGKLLLNGLATAFQALYAAGGPTERGSLRHVRLLRANRLVAEIDFYRFLLEGDRSQDLPLENGDTLHIPVIGPVVTVRGEVRREARYELKGGERLRDALELAGGLRPGAYTPTLHLERIVGNERRTLVSLSAQEFLQQPDHPQNWELQDGDVVSVLSVLPERFQVVSIEGPVARPGDYGWAPGMRVADLLHKAQGIREPIYWQRGNIYRVRPDYTVEVLAFDVRQALEGNPEHNLELRERDRVVLYPPEQVLPERQVKVFGAVRQPGAYPRSEGMRLSDLLFAAGGLLPEAYRPRARLDRVLPDQRLQTFWVDLRAVEERDPQQDLLLEDLDALYVYRVEEVTWKRREVLLRGAVQRPGPYLLAEGMRLAQALFAAGGLLPEAYRERAHLIRRREDGRRELLVVNLEHALNGDMNSDLLLQEGDEIIIYRQDEARWDVRQVRVSGAVQRPGTYDRFEGMRVLDLLTAAGGLLPNAFLTKAELQRYREGDRFEALSLSLENLVETSPHNLLLQDLDHLIVYTVSEVEARRPTVEISGAVQRPGIYPRLEGMRLSDLILKAGGLLPNAHRERAYLERVEDGERVIRLPVDLRRLMEDPRADLLLQDRDRLLIFTVEDVQWRAPVVRISGAVQRPGVYERSEGMRISDLLFLAGGVLPGVYARRANLERVLPNEEKEVLPIEIDRIGNDPAADLLLQDRDHLIVYTIPEVEWRERIVRIEGKVQRPGTYERTQGMRLRDLLFLAGGLLPEAYPIVEIARARGEETAVLQANLERLLFQNDETQNILLEDGDLVSVRASSLYRKEPESVLIQGEVRVPGTYAIRRKERLSEVLQRAGGLTEDAFPEGGILIRRIDKMVTEEQRRMAAEIQRRLLDLTELEYLALTAIQGLQRGAPQRATTPSLPSGTISPTLISTLLAAQTVEQLGALARPGTEVAAPPREVQLLGTGRLGVNFVAALQNPQSPENIELEDGDIIIIPRRPVSVFVEGAVIRAQAIPYREGWTLREYIEQCGGYAVDAAPERMVVVRADGMVLPASRLRTVRPGDIILVPTKALVYREKPTWWERLSEVVRIISNVALTAYALNALGK